MSKWINTCLLKYSKFILCWPSRTVTCVDSQPWSYNISSICFEELSSLQEAMGVKFLRSNPSKDAVTDSKRPIASILRLEGHLSQQKVWIWSNRYLSRSNSNKTIQSYTDPAPKNPDSMADARIRWWQNGMALNGLMLCSAHHNIYVYYHLKCIGLLLHDHLTCHNRHHFILTM